MRCTCFFVSLRKNGIVINQYLHLYDQNPIGKRLFSHAQICWKYQEANTNHSAFAPSLANLNGIDHCRQPRTMSLGSFAGDPQAEKNTTAVIIDKIACLSRIIG